jgi:hypothetical protein
MLVRQLEEELRMRMRNPSVEMQQQMEMLFTENEHLTREIAILRETIKVSIFFVVLFLETHSPPSQHSSNFLRSVECVTNILEAALRLKILVF